MSRSPAFACERRGPLGSLLSVFRNGACSAAAALVFACGAASFAAAAPAHPAARAPRAPASAAPVSMPASLAGIRAQADSLSARLALARWTEASTGVPFRRVEFYPPYASLLTPANIAAVRRAEAGAHAPLARRALQNLRHFLEEQLLAAQVAAIDDTLAALQWADSVHVDSVNLAVAELHDYFGGEKDQGKRVAAFRASDAHFRKTRPMYQARIDSTRAVAGRLGYAGTRQWAEDRRSVRLDDFDRKVREFLSQTTGLYDTALTILSGSSISVARTRVTPPDFERIRRMWWFDEYFPADSAAIVSLTAWKDMGIDLRAQPGLRLDIRRGSGTLAAGCFGVSPPRDVRVHVRLHGGMEDYLAVQQELGLAEQLREAHQALPELRGMGDDVAGQAMASLTGHLVGDSTWTDDYVEMDSFDFAPFVAQSAFKQLADVREAAGRFLFEEDLENASLTPEQAWTLDIRTGLRHPLVEQDAVRALSYADDYACVEQLQAAALGAMLRDSLVRKFGLHFYKAPGGQRVLKSLWATGTELSARDFARRIGYDDVDFGPLARQLRQAIQKKKKPLSEEEQEGP